MDKSYFADHVFCRHPLAQLNLPLSYLPVGPGTCQTNREGQSVFGFLEFLKDGTLEGEVGQSLRATEDHSGRST